MLKLCLRLAILSLQPCTTSVGASIEPNALLLSNRFLRISADASRDSSLPTRSSTTLMIDSIGEIKICVRSAYQHAHVSLDASESTRDGRAHRLAHEDDVSGVNVEGEHEHLKQLCRVSEDGSLVGLAFVYRVAAVLHRDDCKLVSGAYAKRLV